MDFIRPIGSEPELDPLARVQRLKDEREERERQKRERKERGPRTADRPAPPAAAGLPEGPVAGDDGHLHIDIRA